MSSSPYPDFAACAPPAAGSQFALRPLSTGEVLDRTFQLYRGRFWLFAGISAIAPAVSTLFGILQSILVHRVPGGPTALAAQYRSLAVTSLGGLIAFVLYGVTYAATTWAVSALYLGREASMSAAFAAVKPHWFRYSAIALAVLWSAFWPVFILLVAFGMTAALMRGKASAGLISGLLAIGILLSLFYCVWAYLRVLLSTPASVVENLRTRPALRRSKRLLKDRKFRIFLLLLLVGALYMVAGTVQAPFTFLLVRAHGARLVAGTSAILAISFLSGTFLAPISAIALCLFYFDERVRREGFDIEWLLNGQTPQPAAPGMEPPLQEAIFPGVG